ncbi:MAG: FHA domain-containing protein [Myxococcota bacterium]
MAVVNDPKTWLPLGSAQVIDWKHLGRAASARGATAWASRVGTEPVLMRTWCNESTTFYEFYFLGHEAVSGSIMVATNRPEQTRLQIKVTAEVEGRLNYAEITELAEHRRTGLYGVTTRTMDGRVTPDNLETLTPMHAEIFEYAPESALNTLCGAWLSGLLNWIYETVGQDIDAPAPMPSIDLAVPEPARAPEPIRSEPPRPAPAALRPPEPDPAPMPAPVAMAPPPASPSKLVATTTNGDRWEVDAAETYMGRSKQCSIVLKSQRVSRKHASITREDDGFYINDLGAANGIWAGTDKIEREKIENGAEYIIGDVLVSFQYP